MGTGGMVESSFQQPVHWVGTRALPNARSVIGVTQIPQTDAQEQAYFGS